MIAGTAFHRGITLFAVWLASGLIVAQETDDERDNQLRFLRNLREFVKHENYKHVYIEYLHPDPKKEISLDAFVEQLKKVDGRQLLDLLDRIIERSGTNVDKKSFATQVDPRKDTHAFILPDVRIEQTRRRVKKLERNARWQMEIKKHENRWMLYDFD